MRNQLEPVHIPQRTIHLYHCDHRGLPLALINEEGKIDWSADYDVWGSLLSENNPHSQVQDIRLPGQQYDEETGLHYNRHRYYNPRQGRYITQDPIGLAGGWVEFISVSTGSDLRDRSTRIKSVNSWCCSTNDLWFAFIRWHY